MANLPKLLMIVFAIHLTLVLTGIVDVPLVDDNSLFVFLANPGEWDLSAFLSVIDDLFLTIGGLLIIVGTLVTKSDLLVFAGVSGVFLSFGAGLADLFVIIKAASSPEIAMIFVSPIILLYVTTVLAWWRGRSD